MLHAPTADALRTDASSSDPAALISAWKTRNAVVYERFRQVLTDLRTAESPDLAMLSVAMRELRNLSSHIATDNIARSGRSEEHTSELQSPCNLVCRLLLEKKKKVTTQTSANYS